MSTTQPAFAVYTAIDKGRDRKPYWHRIGAAWPTKDGKGFQIRLDSLPLTGTLTLLEPEADNGQGGDQ
jgi:hypothetical protein